jgi:peptide/nickel transport system permease protein
VLKFIIRRLSLSVVILFLASIFVFLLVAFSGDPLALLKSDPRTPAATIAFRAHELHLDLPMWERYWIWFSHAIRGDLGTTIAGEPVSPQLTSHFIITLRMVLAALVFSIIIAISTGVIAAMRRGKFVDRSITFTNFFFLATPVFVTGLFLKFFVALPINNHFGRIVLYTDGDQSPLAEGSFFHRIPDYLGHMVLPTITLVLATYATWSIYQRSTLLETMDLDHVLLARSKGLSKRRVMMRHMLRNALIPVTTVIALDFAGLLGGAVITETVYSWNGLGSWFLDGVNNLDINVTLAYLIVTAIFVIIFNLLADIAYAVLDPRIRLS